MSADSPAPTPGVRFEDVLRQGVPALMQALEEYADHDARRVGLDTVTTPTGKAFEVSTVDLFWDTRNGRFETLVSGPQGETRTFRYPNVEVAGCRHAEIVAALKAGDLSVLH